LGQSLAYEGSPIWTADKHPVFGPDIWTEHVDRHGESIGKGIAPGAAGSASPIAHHASMPTI